MVLHPPHHTVCRWCIQRFSMEQNVVYWQMKHVHTTGKKRRTELRMPDNEGMEWSGHTCFGKARGIAGGKGQKGAREETGKEKGGGGRKRR